MWFACLGVARAIWGERELLQGLVRSEEAEAACEAGILVSTSMDTHERAVRGSVHEPIPE